MYICIYELHCLEICTRDDQIQVLLTLVNMTN